MPLLPLWVFMALSRLNSTFSLWAEAASNSYCNGETPVVLGHVIPCVA